MNRSLSIYNFHYVRDKEGTSFPAIHGPTVAEFEEQVKRLASSHIILSTEEVLASAQDEKSNFPERAAWLTFDDGYLDHYRNVVPVLDRLGLSAAFFPVTSTFESATVLDVNKIQFILAATDDVELVSQINGALKAYASEYGLASIEEYHDKWHRPGRWDSANVMFVKYLLQVGLPKGLRNRITSELFANYVTRDEAAFARELYMSEEEIKECKCAGMYIGCHGHTHCWMDALSDIDQVREIDNSIASLARIGVSCKNSVISYPYGRYDERPLRLAKSRGFALGVTVDPRAAEFDEDALMEIPRFDANDLASLNLQFNE